MCRGVAGVNATPRALCMGSATTKRENAGRITLNFFDALVDNTLHMSRSLPFDF